MWLTSLFANKEIKVYKLIFDWNLKEVQKLLINEPITNAGIFEALLFTTTYILRAIKQGRPNVYPLFEKVYLTELMNYINKQEYKLIIPGKLTDFIDKRIGEYSYELSLILDTEIPYNATKLYYNFFEKPLSSVSAESSDSVSAFKLEYRIKALLIDITTLILNPLINR